MAANFWASSHYNHWIIDRITLEQSREDDLNYANPEQLAVFNIFFTNMMTRLGKRLSCRQQVIATATIYFKRFYLKNSLCDTDPYLVLATCLYVASKIEEVPLAPKAVSTEARVMLSEEYGMKAFPTDYQKVTEMEFYLLEDLDFHLIVHHPYRTVLQLCGEAQANGEYVEEGEHGESAGFWGTGKGALTLEDSTLERVWYTINDTYRGDFCLLYHPHLIAIASLFIALVLDPDTNAKMTQSESGPRYQTRSKHPSDGQLNPLDFLASLNVSYSTVSTIIQETLSLWALWQRHPDIGDTGESAKAKAPRPYNQPGMSDQDVVRLIRDMQQRRESDLAHPPDGRPLPFRVFETGEIEQPPVLGQ